MRVLSRINLYVKGSFGVRAAQTFKVPKAYSSKFSKALKEAIGRHIERTEVKPVPKSMDGMESKYVLVIVTVYVHRLELLKETARRIFTDLERAEKEKEARREEERRIIEEKKKAKKKIKKKTTAHSSHSVGTHIQTVRLRSR